MNLDFQGKVAFVTGAGSGIGRAVCAAPQKANVPTLLYDEQTRGPVPIPPSERNLQTVVAQPWFKVSDQPIVLEGPCFDRNGNLLFSDVYEGRVLRLTPDKHLSVVFTKDKLGPGGLAIHKDGRIFIAGVGDLRGSGCHQALACSTAADIDVAIVRIPSEPMASSLQLTVKLIENKIR